MIPPNDLADLSASQSVDMIRQGDISVPEYVRAHLDRIASVEPQVHAWAHLDPDLARTQARSIQDKLDSGERVGSLPGIPVGVKDVFNTRDMPTQMGSPIWAGFTPGNDARTVHSLRMAGAVLPGKTVTAEFAVHTPGPTLNPHDPTRMAGTSSTGSAVAVACGMVPLALGTQTAGSIIRPASYCGVLGFKPSFGLIPRTGVLKTTDSLDTVGVFARSVEDLALIFDAVRVRGLDYPISHSRLSDPDWQDKGDRPWKVAFVKGPKWGDAEGYAQEAISAFARRLAETRGVIVEEFALSPSFDDAHSIHSTIYDRTLAYYFKEEFKRRTLVSAVLYEIIRRGNELSLDQYKAALGKQADLAKEFDSLFADGYDLVLDLSTGGEALKGIDSTDRPDNCLVWTLCGAPTISLPAFVGPNGLPFGAQIVGRRHTDYRLLDFARFLREAELVPDGTYPPLEMGGDGHRA